ncbi:TetR/AcrR family transcriptional regulator [Nocardioides humi]|uniref:TetR/AcrR family transcriptional regulator n=1 Tax=Nocardioides humi TaxID=449461 RepID=UPI0015E84AA9|nr:TetR/AcrR family transcriptional regulator [Nocardioides humi]
MDALEDLFLREGFGQLKLSDVATRAKCSRRTLYQLAPSKDELVVLVVDRVLQRLGAGARDAAQREERRIDQLRTYLNTVAAGFQRASLAFSRDVDAHPATRRVFAAHTAYSVTLMESIVVAGIRDGEFRNVHPGFTAQVLSDGITSVLDPEFLERSQLTLSAALAELGNLVAYGLIREPAGVSYNT